MERKLQRIPHEGAVAGVCAGLGEYFGIDKTWIRLAFIISVFFSGYMGVGLLGPIVYIVLWIVLPIKSFSLPHDPFDVDYRASQNQKSTDYEAGYPYNWNVGGKAQTFKQSKDRYIAGLILLAVGLFFLLHQLDVLYWRDFARYWPVLIIIMGLASIFGAFTNKKEQTYPHEKEEEYTQDPEQPTNGDNEEGHAYTK
ncbi:PspC domain-containing protein [Parapedobacter tibetensis]|uniref:PspC domain-containing protein n=1 Tax=Parapedobacter tibetensis TaxID=2972951 RepID=UPI00214DEAD4|nr:PspC domain-containing protein [Parapedobacter tibetensis]